jgi:hypothetical protein
MVEGLTEKVAEDKVGAGTTVSVPVAVAVAGVVAPFATVSVYV